MGVGSFLGSLGKAAVGLIPGVGPGLSAALSGIGGVAGGAAKGSADQRMREQPLILDTQKANDRRMMLSGLLGGLEDAHIGRPDGSTIPTFNMTGGLRPSAISNKEALIKQLGTPIESPKAGTMEKIMGGVGLGASILGELGKIGKTPAAQYGFGAPPGGGNQNASAGVPQFPAGMDPSMFDPKKLFVGGGIGGWIPSQNPAMNPAVWDRVMF
jgi:hypothetical protein